MNSGLNAWIIQRISAYYIAGFCVYCVIYFTLNPINSYAEWHAWVSGRVTNIALGVFYFVLLLHSWVGTRDILLDYIKPFWLRASALVVLLISLIALALWVLRILMSV